MSTLPETIRALTPALEGLSPAELAAVLGALEEVKGLALARLLRPATPAEPDGLLTMRQAAERLGLPPSRAYELARQGRLPAVRIGKYVRISSQALSRYQASLPGPGLDGKSLTLLRSRP